MHSLNTHKQSIHLTESITTSSLSPTVNTLKKREKEICALSHPMRKGRRGKEGEITGASGAHPNRTQTIAGAPRSAPGPPPDRTGYKGKGVGTQPPRTRPLSLSSSLPLRSCPAPRTESVQLAPSAQGVHSGASTRRFGCATNAGEGGGRSGQEIDGR